MGYSEHRRGKDKKEVTHFLFFYSLLNSCIADFFIIILSQPIVVKGESTSPPVLLPPGDDKGLFLGKQIEKRFFLGFF